MVEYGATSSSARKRKRVANDTPTSSQANVKKKKHTDSSNGSANDIYNTTAATTPAKRKRPTIQQNAEAGPSTQRKSTASDFVTPTRTSTRVSRPTMRKVASQATKNRSKALQDYSDSDSDSDRTPPPGIIRSPKKHKISTPKKVGLSQSHQSIPKPKVVKHLGAFEISSGSENDIRPPPPPRKKSKISVRPATPPDIINLCSDEDIPPKVSQKKSTQAQEDDIVVIQSSDEESGPVCAFATETTPILVNPSQSTPSNVTRLYETESTEIPEPALGDIDLPMGEQPSSVSTIDSHAMDLTPDLATVEVVEPPEIILDVNALQASYSEAMLDPRHSSENRSRRFIAISAFSTSMVSIRPRAIVFAETMPSPTLHTPVYFSRTLEFSRKKAKAKKVRLASIQNVIAKTPIVTVSAPHSALTKTSRPASCLPTKTMAPTAMSSVSSDQEQQNQEILPRDCPAPISAIQEDIVMEDAQDLSNQSCLDDLSVVPPSDSPSLGKVESMAVPLEAVNRSVTAIIEKVILDIPSTPSSLSATIDTHGSRSLSASQDDPSNNGHSSNEGFPDPGSAHLRQSLEECPEDGAPPRIGHVEIYSESSNPGIGQTAGTSSAEDLTLVQPDEIVKSRNLLKLLRGIMQSKKSGARMDTLRVPVEDKRVSPDDSAKVQLPQAVDPFPRENHDNSDRPPISVAEKEEAPETETSNSGIAVDYVPLSAMDISLPIADEETIVSYPTSPPYDPISPTAFVALVPSQMDVDGLDLDAMLSLSPAALEESFVEMEITTIGPASSTTSEEAVLVLEDLDAVSPSSTTTLADVPIMATTTTAMPLEDIEFGTTYANEDAIPPTDTSASPAKAQEQPPNPTVPEVMLTHDNILDSDILQVNSTPHIIDPPTDTLKDFVSLESSSTKPSSPTQRKAVPIIQAASQRLPIDLSFLGQNAPVIDISSLMENLNYEEEEEDDIDLSDLELAYPE